VTFILGDVDCDIVDDDDHEELRRSGRVTRQDVDDKSSEASTDKDDKTSDDKPSEDKTSDDKMSDDQTSDDQTSDDKTSDDKMSDDKTSGTKSINNFTCVA
jgi:hypothetical protein